MKMTTKIMGDQNQYVATKLELKQDSLSDLTAGIHKSLLLPEVLHACRTVLEQVLPLRRLSLVQKRANESTATLYTLNKKAEDPIKGPQVIIVESSRLSRCISEPRRRIINFSHVTEQDGPERDYLLFPKTQIAVYLPVMLERNLKGVLVLALSGNEPLDPDHMAFLDYLAEHLALAMENSDLHYLECRRGRQLSMVSEIAKRAVLIEDLEIFLNETSELIRTCFDYLTVQIWSASSIGDKLVLEAVSRKHTLLSQDTPPPEMVKDCSRRNRTLCDNNILDGTAKESEYELPNSRLAVPIRLRGKLLGVLFLESNRLDAFPDKDLNTMEGLASLIASTYDNLRSLEHIQQSSEYMQAILESAKDLAILSTDTRGQVITCSVGSESLLQLSNKEILGKDILTLFTNPHFRQELAGYITGQDTTIFERKRLSQALGRKNYFLDITVQHVYDSEKRPIGFLCIVQDVTENVLLERRLEALSITDELTGLYNRRRFYLALSSEVERCRRFNRKVSLCFLDLDGFKKYNDTYGHLKGDQALKDAAELLLGIVRSNVDSCYRYGGDELTIIMPETSKQDARGVTERIREQLNEHFHGMITASVGIAESAPYMEVEELIGKADRAMYNAKTQGGNRTILVD